MDKYEIIALSKDKWKGTIIPMTIRSDSYYDFEIRPFDNNGCRISMIRKPAESEIVHNPEEWSNRLVVTELWVSEELRRKGVGKRLMDKAKEVAIRQKRRAVILETQSCNTNAIGFYLHQGFELIGFDTCCYTNEDIARREVRVNLGFFLSRAEE